MTRFSFKACPSKCLALVGYVEVQFDQIHHWDASPQAKYYSTFGTVSLNEYLAYLLSVLPDTNSIFPQRLKDNVEHVKSNTNVVFKSTVQGVKVVVYSTLWMHELDFEMWKICRRCRKAPHLHRMFRSIFLQLENEQWTHTMFIALNRTCHIHIKKNVPDHHSAGAKILEQSHRTSRLVHISVYYTTIFSKALHPISRNDPDVVVVESRGGFLVHLSTCGQDRKARYQSHPYIFVFECGPRNEVFLG